MPGAEYSAIFVWYIYTVREEARGHDYNASAKRKRARH
jgi:hypothetical protein